MQRNKGHTQELGDLIQIPIQEAGLFKESILGILDLIKVEDCNRVQQEYIKNIYRLLEYFSKSE
ncbi:hypothetical protein [Algoriphagus zhangzhouensis]|uniref:Uncharacterized protein n=1 Tax=Algoriphagus zhangzhouensis TaxID=1073327 RepID=A0A1M7ZKG6_9BACT|nr:hypothetical protein [Algoriphagus zhangzhouensis]TDY42858.1 hypothetical protein A8938_4037 [Algoriphagus zhangzhouensis]SHO65371.1 hypothetical protein SAMN04488108_4032 [Algoriphagus zhangzhouensis]